MAFFDEDSMRLSLPFIVVFVGITGLLSPFKKCGTQDEDPTITYGQELGPRDSFALEIINLVKDGRESASKTTHEQRPS